MAKLENVYIDFNNRTLFLSDEVDNVTIGKMSSILLSLIKSDDEKDNTQKDYKRLPIHIYINSFGGSTYDMWTLIEIMLSSKTPIYTYCTGYAMSAGFKIFLAGHKRFISKRAKLLYHQLSGCNYGSYTDMKQDLEEIELDQKEIEEFVMERTKITQKKLDEVRDRKLDWYIHSDEAIKLGIADEII